MPGSADTSGVCPFPFILQLDFRRPRRESLIQSEFPMAKTEREYRQDIIEVGRLVYEKGWVAANDGNITVRMSDDRYLATPTGVSKGMMHPDDLIIVDGDGNKIQGRKNQTSEFAMHLTVYNLRPDIGGVVHAHPPVATGYAAAGKALNLALLPEVIIGLGCVPLADYGLPGTDELTKPMLPLIPKYDALMMGNHGAVCYGEDIWKAFFRMETVEHFARIALVAELLGGAKVLPRSEVDKLLDSRTRYGVKTRSGGVYGCPLVAEDVGQSDRISVTREELIELVNEALKARGIA
jgi:L-fuculose-phosphate aldolase